MASSNRYIKKSATGGGWDVVKEGHRRATAHAATKKDAIDAARKMIRREGGGELRVMNRSGKIAAADTVRPGRRTHSRRFAA